MPLCRPAPLRRAAAVAAAILVLGAPSAVLADAPPTLEQILADFGYPADAAGQVRAGQVVEKGLDATSLRELATSMAFLVKAPPKKVVQLFEEGKGFKDDPQVVAVVQLPADAGPDALKAVVLDPGGDAEAQRYLAAAPGDTLNLSNEEIARFTALSGGGKAPVGKSAVEQALRGVLADRLQAYRSKGLAGVAPYARAKNAQSQPGMELRRATEAAIGLRKYAPSFHNALRTYPEGKPAELAETFFSIRYDIGGRPNVTLRHRLAMPVGDAYAVVDREFYVSHDYNETQAVAAMLPVDGGTAVLYANRTTTDQLGGFGASAKQAIGRSMLAKQIRAIFEKARNDPSLH